MKHNFKIRCSEIGQIMTEARSKTEPLSKTTQSYLQLWAKEQIYGRRKDITTKYMEKGIECELESIQFVAKHIYPKWLLLKNDQFFEDEHMTGTPDLLIENKVIDIKNSWDFSTFPLFEQEPDKNYYWQLQGYMSLTDKTEAEVIYTLMNTPEEIVDQEINRAIYKGDWNEEIEQEIRAYHNYDSIPVKYRIKSFQIYRNQEDIDRIKSRVEECRNYLNSL